MPGAKRDACPGGGGPRPGQALALCPGHPEDMEAERRITECPRPREAAWRPRGDLLRYTVAKTRISQGWGPPRMGYRTLAECVDDLRAHGQLVAIDAGDRPAPGGGRHPAAGLRGGGAGAPVPTRQGERRSRCVGNLFGTIERTRFLFRDTLEAVRRLVELKVSPPAAAGPLAVSRRADGGAAPAPARVVAGADPGASRRRSTACRSSSRGRATAGPFVTLPQVYTEDPDRPGLARSNLGMYRVQISGNAYEPNREVGLHYQIHRGIGVHHAAAIRRGEPLRVNVFVGGPPALTVAAVMPLPEGLPELSFAGALAGRRIAMVAPEGGLPMPAEADFVIVGTVDPSLRKPEGPFGDHLGYYSLTHDFPVLRVERVYHRAGAIWPFTSVGRPPQEDTSFGALIHELTGPLVPTVLPGVHAVHAVDAAGVHPLLLAIASERYVPYAEVRRPQEILTERQRDPRPGADVAGQVSADRRPRGRPRPRHPRRPGVPPPPPRTGRLGERPPLPDPDDDRHARLLGPRPQPGLEGRDRGGRAPAPRPADRGPRRTSRSPKASTRPASACPGILAVQGPPYRARVDSALGRLLPVVRRRTIRSASSR